MTTATCQDRERRGSIRVDYHFHTEFSYDSRTTAEAVLERALEAKLDVLCVTDHDTIAGAIELAGIRCPQVRVIVGCEFTSDDGSHVIGLGLRDMIAERRTFALLESIKLQGGLVVLPHPFRRGSGIFRNEMRRPDEFLRRALSLADMVECFNGRDNYENNQKSRELVSSLGLPAVAGSDAHTAPEIGSVFVEYDDHEPAHGISPRRIFFPDQAPALEHPLKRKLMELYHANKDRLPPVAARAYRALKARLGRERPRDLEAVPRVQYEFPLASGRARSR